MRPLYYCRIGLLLGLSGSLWAETKPKENYFVRPSSQTVKKRESALALGESKDASAAGASLLQAMDDQDSMTRSLAVQSAGRLRSTHAAAKLADLLVNDPSAEVREAAATSLRQIGDPDSLAALRKALNDPVSNVRITALMGIASSKDVGARLAVEGASKDKAPEVRRTAVFALGRLEDPKSIPLVEGLLKDSDASVRAGAAHALGEFRSTGSKPALEELLKDPDKSVKASTARTLLMLGDPMGLEPAKSLVSDENIAVRLLAIDALGWTKDPTAKSTLDSLKLTAPANSQKAVREALARNELLRNRK